MVDDTDPEVESDLRRRAAWLLGMLVIVAVLLLIVIGAVSGTHKHTSAGNAGPGPLDSVATQTGAPATSAKPTPPPSSHRRVRPTRAASSTPPVHGTSCPGASPCVLQGDVGNGIQAINAYRTQQGLPAVPGTVSPQAQTCAVQNGNGCSGGWAETELAVPNGQQAVQKILPFAHLTDPQMKSVEVGWAYDPGAKLYYFAIIRID